MKHTIDLTDEESITLEAMRAEDKIVTKAKDVDEWLTLYIKYQIGGWALEDKDRRITIIMAAIQGDPVKLADLEQYLKKPKEK
jgi:hypothetical protein